MLSNYGIEDILITFVIDIEWGEIFSITNQPRNKIGDMRKLFSIIALGLILAAVISCRMGGGPAGEIIDVINKATEQINKTQDSSEATAISLQAMADVAKIYSDNPDFKPTPDEDKDIHAAARNLEDALRQKMGAFSPVDSTEIEELYQETPESDGN